MKKVEEIRKIINKHEEILKKKYKVKKMALFGSYLRKQTRKDSDLDIVVEFCESVSLLKLVALENFLTDILGTKVDVVPKEDIRPELKKNILSEAVDI